jgi:hypothetical protein
MRYQPLLYCPLCELSAGVEPQFRQHAADVDLGSALRDHELFGDLPVASARVRSGRMYSTSKTRERPDVFLLVDALRRSHS